MPALPTAIEVKHYLNVTANGQQKIMAGAKLMTVQRWDEIRHIQEGDWIQLILPKYEQMPLLAGSVLVQADRVETLSSNPEDWTSSILTMEGIPAATVEEQREIMAHVRDRLFGNAPLGYVELALLQY